MGFLSSLFSFGDSPTTKTTQVTPQFPEELKPYIEEILKGQQTVYESKIDEGYKPYTGETIAGFTPEEIASQEGLKALIGTQAPLQQEALDLARGTSREFTPEEAQKYMSPYLRTALDAQKAAAQRQFEGTKLPEFEAQAVRAGGMSGLGSRAGVQAAELQSGQNRLLADIEAKGQQQAYEQAADLFKDQARREAAVGTTLAQAAPQIFKSGLLEQGTLQTIGEQKRDLAQSALDEAYLKFIEQKQYPESALAAYQSAIYGNPLLKQPSYTQTGTTTGGSPGLGKTLLGLGATAMGFGVPGGGTIGGSLFKGAFPSMFKAGGGSVGGLSSTPQARPYINYMRRNMGGKVVPPVVYRQESGQTSPSIFPIRTGPFVLKLNKDPILDSLRKKEIAMGKPTGEEIIAKRKELLEAQDAKRFEEEYRRASASKRLEMDRLRNLKNKAVPMSTAVDASPTENLSEIKDDSTMPVIIGSEEKYKEKGLEVPDFVGDEDPTAVDNQVARVTEKKVMNDLLNKVKENPSAIDLLNKRFKAYKEGVGKEIDSNPLEKQKFWATIGAGIMKPGNAFANIPKAIEDAINGLDADVKTKRKLRISLLGKEFEKDIAVAKTMSKSTAARLDRLNKLKIALVNSRGKAAEALRKEISKEKLKILGNTQNVIKSMGRDDIKSMLEEHVKNLKGDSAAKKALLDKIDDIDPDALYTRIISLPNRKRNTLASVFDAYLSKLQK